MHWSILASLASVALSGKLHPYPQHKQGTIIPGQSSTSRIFEMLNDLDLPTSPCDGCKHILNLLKRAAISESDVMPRLLSRMCSTLKDFTGHTYLCDSIAMYDNGRSNEFFSFLPDLAATLREMDPDGLDGDYFCHYMFGGACERPPTPHIDFDSYWPPKDVAKLSLLPKSKGRTFKALHISDIHLSINYTEHAPANCLGAMCCDNLSFQSPFQPAVEAPKWGHFRCDAPYQLLEDTLRNATGFTDYEFAIFTGDMVDHNPAFINKHDTLLEEEVTLRSLKSALGDIPVYPVMGNHDTYPYGQEPPPNGVDSQRTAFNIDLMQDLWSPWLDDSALEQVKTTHGGYAIMARPGLKVISLNSNYWYRWNFYNYDDTENADSGGIIQFMIDELVDCEQRGIKAWVQAHVPTGGVEEEAIPTTSALFTAAIERFSDTVAAVFFGHTHYDEFTLLYADGAKSRVMDRAINMAWIAPSVTPFTDLNPSWRYYEVDADTFEIMDAVTFYASIEPAFGVEWDEAPDLDWRVEYSVRDTYGARLNWPVTEPLNAKFWHLVAAEILEDPKMAQEFVRKKYRNTSVAPQCTSDTCRAQLYCYATSFSVDQVKECRKEFNLIGLSERSALAGVPTFPMPRMDRSGHYDFASL